jgi:hypothetical protein
MLFSLPPPEDIFMIRIAALAITLTFAGSALADPAGKIKSGLIGSYLWTSPSKSELSAPELWASPAISNDQSSAQRSNSGLFDDNIGTGAEQAGELFP